MINKKLYIDDSSFPDNIDNIEIINRFGKREITHVFHDIDGTHSLIRDWPPVMSLTLHSVIENGLPNGYDSDESIEKLIKRVGEKPLYETDKFCVESAGLSALTQMEWAIRRAVSEGSILLPCMDENACRVNLEIIERIWAGDELFDDIYEPPFLKEYLKIHTPRLFFVYEKILNGACRDRNVQAALENPESMRVSGSFEFIKRLYELGAENYFVTGAVISYDKHGKPHGGMYEEVCAVGFDVGEGKMVKTVKGSTWDEKIPKAEVMKKLCKEENIDSSKVLIIGDGRSEIAAAAYMNAVTISRLPIDAVRQRELHKDLKTNIIVSDYTSPNFLKLFNKKEDIEK